MENKENAYKKKGERVREVRKLAGLSREDLAKRLGYSRGLVDAIEQGRRNLTYENAERIAAECKCSVDYLLLRSDYRTSTEMYKAMSDRSEKISLMWKVFLSRVAENIGYDFYLFQGYQEEFENSGTLFVFRDEKGKEYFFDYVDDIFPLLDEIQAHSGLALKRMIAKAAIKESAKAKEKEGDVSNGKGEREEEQEGKR